MKVFISHRATRVLGLMGTAALMSGLATTARAQTATTEKQTATTESMPDDIVVTATKQTGGVKAHDAPLAITALGEEQLKSANIVSIADIGHLAPNVLLNTSSASPNINNFSIRGMALYSSIPSSTSTVGVFTDGMYIGAGPGTGLQTFDLAGVEVLRGPQGLLFGRNVTAGAVLVRTSDPTDTLRIRAEAGMETGPNFTESVVVSGPLVANGALDAKLGYYRNDDDGWFRNLADGGRFGASTTNIIRAALSTRPASNLKSTLKFEYGDNSGDGPATQNQGVWRPGTFDFAISRVGFAKGHYYQAISETTLDVGFGKGGQIVNIAGWRQIEQKNLNDQDSLPQFIFNFGLFTGHHQLSDELRYSGTFGPVTATVGAFVYGDMLHYVEQRDFSTSSGSLTGGGNVKSQQYAAFSNFDIALSRDITFSVGGRYSIEKKWGSVQALSTSGAANPCSFLSDKCSAFAFNDSKTWRSFNPKVGLQWKPSADTNLYGYWARGNRSGGYNVRQAAAFVSPGPYGMETQDAFEVGLKQRAFDRRLNLNIAAFVNKYRGIQRDVNILDPVLGSYQFTTNAGNVTIKGVELDVSWAVTPELTLSGFYGHVDARYTSLKYGFLLKGPVSPADFDLGLPFAPPNSAGAAINYDRRINLVKIGARVSFAYQQSAPANDTNTVFISPINELSANLSINHDNGLGISIYGKNLLNKATWGLTSPSPFNPGGTFTPLNKGRVIGVKLSYSFGGD